MNRSVLTGLLILALVITGCAAPAPEPASPPAKPAAAVPASPEADQALELTLEELAKFNGKDGARAYIAVDGIIYDVTDVPPWKGGTHQGKVQAGIDASEMILTSPHGKKVLEKLPVVGKIKQ